MYKYSLPGLNSLWNNLCQQSLQRGSFRFRSGQLLVHNHIHTLLHGHSYLMIAVCVVLWTFTPIWGPWFSGAGYRQGCVCALLQSDYALLPKHSPMPSDAATTMLNFPPNMKPGSQPKEFNLNLSLESIRCMFKVHQRQFHTVKMFSISVTQIKMQNSFYRFKYFKHLCLVICEIMSDRKWKLF